MAREEKDPVTMSALAQFRTALDKAATIEDALSDPRILRCWRGARPCGPGRQCRPAAQGAALRPEDEASLAARLGATWKAAATTLGVHGTGLAGLKDEALVETLTDAYVKYQYRSGLDDSQAGLSDALYFLDAAQGATDVYSLLGDAVMRRVVTGALGLPDEIAIQSVETQGRAVTSRLDLEDLQDGKKLRKLAERYLIAAANAAAEKAASSAGGTDAIATITSLAVSLRA